MKAQTMDEFCGNPPGTFKKFIQERETRMQAIEQHRKDRIRAIRNNQPVPELGFEVELWMLA